MSAPPVHELLATTLRRARRERLWTAGPSTQTLDLRGEALERLLPHRAPFLLVSAITHIDLEQRTIAGSRALDPADPVFAGHFPGEPIYPGVLLIEAMAQLATCFRPIEVGGPAQRSFATSCQAVFLRPVRPGDVLTLLGQCVGTYDGLYERGVGQVLVGDTICAAAIVEGCHVE